MIPDASRFERCARAADHRVLKLPVIRPAYGEKDKVGYLDVFEDGACVVTLPIDRGAAWVLVYRLMELLRD